MHAKLHSPTYGSSTAATGATAPSTAADKTVDFGRLRLRFALAIAKPGGKAGLIDEENKLRCWVPIADAISAKVAFTVDVAEDILPVDSDRPDNASAVYELVEELRRHRHPSVLVASGQVGHFHVFARVADRTVRERFAQRARDVGLDVRKSIRPPLTPHRLGLRSQLLQPADPNAALAVLRVPGLSARMRQLLRQGDPERGYRSRSEVVQALALGAVNAGWSLQRLLWELSDRRNLGGEKVQEMMARNGRAEAERYVRKSFTKAEARALKAPEIRDRDAACRTIEALIDEADRHPWSGRAGASALAVLHAHFDVSSRKGSLEYGLAVREAAERAGLSTPTASKAQRGLIAAGWLRRISTGSGCVASAWKLSFPTRAHLTHSLPQGGV